MSMPGSPAAQEISAEVEEVLAALSGSVTLDLLGMTTDDLQAARSDADLFETLKITHELIMVLRDKGVLPTFLLLPKDEQVNFVRWIAATDEEGLRHEAAEIFVSALKQSPLADRTGVAGPG